MPKVLIADKVDKIAKEILEKNDFVVDEKIGLSEDELKEVVKDYDVLIVRSSVKVTKAIIENGEKLKIIARAGIGTDNIDISYAKERGIAVINSPFGNINAAAEHTITLMLLTAKRVVEANEAMKKEIWERKSFKGIELKNKILGVIGFGKVGRIVSSIAKSFGMKIIAYDPFVSKEEMLKQDVKKIDFDELISEADFITVHLPITKETENLIGKEEFAKMKQGVRILNVARGGIVNEDALYDALNSGKVSYAGIDVWQKEPLEDWKLAKHERVIATPHLGASTFEAQQRVAKEIAEAIISAFKGKIINCVNGVESLK